MTSTTVTRSRYPARTTGAGLGRLTRIELRKSVDTRAGRWLLIAVAAVGLIIAVLSALLGSAKNQTFHQNAASIQGAMAVLLPIVSILLVTSEFSQRTALQTFVLVPRRGLIVAAKLLSGAVIAVAFAGYGTVLSLLATGAAAHPATAGRWQHAALVVLGSLIVQLISQLSGMGFGLLLMSSAGAIVANFVIPIAWAGLAGGIQALHGVQPWLDPSKVSTYLLNGEMSVQRWAQVCVVALIWVAALLAAGTHRARRTDIS